MILPLGIFFPMFYWILTQTVDADEKTPPTWIVEDLGKCEPEDSELKKVHKVLPRWLPYQIQTRKVSDLAKKLTIQGRSYAGRNEFPWLVELREKPTENWTNAGNWANGNLMTGKYVLTTCEAVATFKQSTLGGNAFDEELGVPNWYLEKKDPENYQVMYGSSYPYVVRTFNKDEVGTRNISGFYPHPKCNYFVLDYSLGIVRIRDQSIWPFPPYTAYMPQDMDCDGYQKMKAYYNARRRTPRDEDNCYIALWSRWIFGDEIITQTKDPKKFWRFGQLWNHKVRYIVRPINPVKCQRNIAAYPERIRRQESALYECMGLDDTETVGVLCNHDRGAPIVCNGVVRAIMLAGATEEYCSNTKPLPFLVIDARFMYSMWTNVNAFALKNTSLLDLDLKQRSRAPGCFSAGNAVFILVLWVIYYIMTLS